MPFTKCAVRENPIDLTINDDIFVFKKNNLIYIDGFTYECSENFEKKDNEPPNAVDDRCFTPEYTPTPNSHTCSGEPYHEDFFHFNTENA